MTKTMNNNDLDLVYISAAAPDVFYQNFRNEEQFLDYLEKGNEQDLKNLLQQYEAEEMYDICAITLDFITKKFQ